MWSNAFWRVPLWKAQDFLVSACDNYSEIYSWSQSLYEDVKYFYPVIYLKPLSQVIWLLCDSAVRNHVIVN